MTDSFQGKHITQEVNNLERRIMWILKFWRVLNGKLCLKPSGLLVYIKDSLQGIDTMQYDV